MFRKSVFASLFVLLLVGVVAVNLQSVPVKAQGGETPETEGDFSAWIPFSGTVVTITTVSGPVTLITLDDNTVIKVNPATQVSGDELKVGATVTGQASVEDDGLVAKTMVVTAAAAPTATLTPTLTPTATSDADVTPTTTPTLTPTTTASASASAAACGSGNTQPVAARLADAFGVSYDEIMGWFCKGFGFGEIARAYFLAEKTGTSVEAIFAMRTAGQGWGQIVKQLGVDPKDLAPGKAISKGKGKGSATPPGKGKGKGKGNGNGNNN